MGEHLHGHYRLAISGGNLSSSSDPEDNVNKSVGIWNVKIDARMNEKH